MQVSAEIRYWWRKSEASRIEKWFHEGRCPPGGGETRIDEYLKDPGQMELGIKRRGAQPGAEIKPGVEIKGLVARCERLPDTPFPGQVEIWTKWSSASLQLDPPATIAVTKQRWMRKFDTGSGTAREIPLDSSERSAARDPLPKDGCNVEFTSLRLPDGDPWWTLGFEAFGELYSVERSLRIAMAEMASRQPPAILPALVASYPAWLDRLTRK